LTAKDSGLAPNREKQCRRKGFKKKEFGWVELVAKKSNPGVVGETGSEKGQGGEPGVPRTGTGGGKSRAGFD